MSRLEEISDVKTLQQVASHLEKATIRQSKQIARLRAEVARLKGQDADPQMELKLLKEQLAAMQRMVFAESSERRPREAKTDDEKPKAPRRGHGPKSQPNLPAEEVKHTIDEKDRSCSICGEVLTEMGDQTEESEEITVIGVEYKILKHRRQKYRCRCNEQVMTALGPAKLIPGGRYSVDFAVHVAEFTTGAIAVYASMISGLKPPGGSVYGRSANTEPSTLSSRSWNSKVTSPVFSTSTL